MEESYKDSPLNPLNMNTHQIEQWVNDWHEQEESLGHIFKQPAPCLLTSAYAQDVVKGYKIDY